MSPPWESYLYLATAAVGTAMSSLILHAINSSRARLLVSRLDRCVLLLVAVNCLWAAASLLRLVVAVAMDSTDMGGFGVFQLVVVYNCIGWSLLVNVCLALARYFTYTETPESMSRKYYLPLACLFIASTASVVVLGATAPPCLRMGLTPMACLLPAIAVLFTCYATGKSQQDLPKWVHVLESECYIADAIFTPIVVMYFMKRIRLRVFDLVFPGKQRLLDAPSSSFEISSACEYSDDQELDIEFDQHFAEQSQNEEACGIISDTDTWRVAKP
ncbi:hypothetical protein HDU82_002152 [Entophlyctis luteolus]|nr:hypothetical protein HDU82_002152 [Entophlyctis luteolus]